MRFSLLVIAPWLLLSAALGAGAQAPPSPVLPDSIQGLLLEIGGLRERFESAQRKALESDVGLSDKQREIRDLVNTTVLRLRPEIAELLAALPQIQSAAAAAEQAGELERLEALVADARRIQTAVEDAQTEALEEPGVAREIEAFEGRMVEGMKRFEPEIESVLARIQAIASRLQSWVGKPL